MLAAVAFGFGLLLATGIWEKTQSLPGPVVHQSGNLYISEPISVSLPALFYVPSDNVAGPSNLELFLGSKRLGPAHALHQEIRDLGNGRYSHWSGRVLFSTPNGQVEDLSVRYSIRLKPALMWLFFLLAVSPALPRFARITVNAVSQLSSSCLRALRQDPVSILVTAIGLLAVTTFVPPTWNSVDSIAIALWPDSLIPHFPWGYMLLVYGMESILGLAAGVQAVLYIQMGIFFFAVVYFLFSFRFLMVRLLLLLLIFSQFYILLIQRGIYTEAMGISGLFFIMGATLRQSEEERMENIWVYLWGTLLCALSRYPFIIFGAILPVYVLLTAVWTRSRALLLRSLSLSAIFLVVFFLVAPSSKLVCRLLGNYNCELTSGRVGADLVHTSLLRLPNDERSKEVKILQNYSKNDLVKTFFDAAANDKNSGWVDILEEMVLRSNAQGNSHTQADAQRAAAKGTLIFKIHGSRMYYDMFRDNITSYFFNSLSFTKNIVEDSKDALDRIFSHPGYEPLIALVPNRLRIKDRLNELENSSLIHNVDNISTPINTRSSFIALIMLALIGRYTNVVCLLFALSCTYLMYCGGMSAFVPYDGRYDTSGHIILALGAAAGFGLLLSSWQWAPSQQPPSSRNQTLRSA